MDPATIASAASALLGAASTVTSLVSQAIDASRAGDDQKALDLLNAALAHLEAATPGTRADLAAALEKNLNDLDAKFAPAAIAKAAEKA